MGLSVLASIYEGTDSKELSKCFDSLEAQTLPADEIVLVIDGPITSPVRVCVDRYSAILPIRILEFSQNRGLGPALHDGLLACSHDLIARVDTDDQSLPARFETQVRFLQQASLVSVVGGMMREQTHKNTKTGSLVTTKFLELHGSATPLTILLLSFAKMTSSLAGITEITGSLKTTNFGLGLY